MPGPRHAEYHAAEAGRLLDIAADSKYREPRDGVEAHAVTMETIALATRAAAHVALATYLREDRSNG